MQVFFYKPSLFSAVLPLIQMQTGSRVTKNWSFWKTASSMKIFRKLLSLTKDRVFYFFWLFLFLIDVIFCLFAPLYPLKQLRINVRQNQNSARSELSKQDLYPHKRPSNLPLHERREESQGIFLHFTNCIFQCNVPQLALKVNFMRLTSPHSLRV